MKGARKLILLITAVIFLTGCAGTTDHMETTEETQDLNEESSPESPSSPENIEDTDGLAALRGLYVDFPQTANYPDAVAFIQESQLPYSETKQNGSRLIKIALKKSDTDIDPADTFKEYDYIEILYTYPKMENDDLDQLDHYLFAGISYVSSEGNYVLSSHAETTHITRDGEVVDSRRDRREQMDFLENHT